MKWQLLFPSNTEEGQYNNIYLKHTTSPPLYQKTPWYTVGTKSLRCCFAFQDLCSFNL